MKNKMDLYLFSGTGNTELIGQRFSDRLSEKGVPISILPMEKVFQKEGTLPEIIGFAFPANSQSVSPLVWRFFKSLPQGNRTKAFCIVTMNESTSILKPLEKLLKKKGYIPEATCEISMPNNMLMAPADENVDKLRIEKAYLKIDEFAERLATGQASWQEEHKGMGFVSFLARNTGLPFFFMRKMLRLETQKELCTQCGLCIRQCPVHNIQTSDVPVHGSRCEFCMRCAANCPSSAITVKGKKEIRFRKTVK